MANPVVLRDLLRSRHWQVYATFCREYDKAAAKIDRSYVGGAPGRAQLHRWTSGDLKGLPHPQHCEVLEGMFPGVTVEEMFSPSPRSAETAVDLAEAVEEGLNGDAPLPAAWADASEPATPAPPLTVHRRTRTPDQGEALTRSLQLLGKKMRLPDEEVAELGLLAGQVVDLELDCSIDIDADGWAAVTYRFVLLNLTNAPVKRLLREQWFENTEGVRIEAYNSSDRRVSVQRLHDIGNMVKFALVFAPGIEPGEVGTISYTVHGGRFLHDHFWQQGTLRPTRHLTLSIRQRGVDMLLGCNAVEEQPDGSQLSAIDDLFCTEEDDGALITVTRNYLQPGQSVTVRWEVTRAVA